MMIVLYYMHIAPMNTSFIGTIALLTYYQVSDMDTYRFELQKIQEWC